MKGGQNMKDIKLVKKAIRGDNKAFEELLVIHSEQLYRTAFIYVQNREDALDIVQETAYKGLLSIRQLKNAEYFLTWLTKILIHCAYDLIKKKKNELPLENEFELTSANQDRNIERLDLIEALNELKEKYKSAIILFYFQDMPIHEVAKVMDVPENSVKTYLYRGKAQLNKLLGGNQYNGQEALSSRI